MSNIDPRPTLWLRLRSMFARAVEALGDAVSIAALPALTPEARRRIIAWLCPLEHIVRKLLLAEAAALIAPKRTAPRAPCGSNTCRCEVWRCTR